MTTNKVDVAAPSTVTAPPPPAAPQGSLVRLLVLLGMLALVVGAYAYDFLVARPGCEAADKKIQAFVDERNKMGVKDGALVTPADIQKELGMKPTRTDKFPNDGYEVEYYCWWGHVPMMGMRRHFISVVYVGNEPRRFSSHHRELPPEEALPIVQQPSSDDGQPLPEPSTGGGKKGESSGEKGGDAAAAPASESKANEAASEPTKDKAASDKAASGE